MKRPRVKNATEESIQSLSEYSLEKWESELKRAANLTQKVRQERATDKLMAIRARITSNGYYLSQERISFLDLNHHTYECVKVPITLLVRHDPFVMVLCEDDSSPSNLWKLFEAEIKKQLGKGNFQDVHKIVGSQFSAKRMEWYLYGREIYHIKDPKCSITVAAPVKEGDKDGTITFTYTDYCSSKSHYSTKDHPSLSWYDVRCYGGAIISPIDELEDSDSDSSSS